MKIVYGFLKIASSIFDQVFTINLFCCGIGVTNDFLVFVVVIHPTVEEQSSAIKIGSNLFNNQYILTIGGIFEGEALDAKNNMLFISPRPIK